MYISEITIEGFKSYASRVTLNNLDECFNAITGLNGTGKSNILDSICFVLGLKNLSQARATSLQDLVYKQGQAGITKATVCITFHNNDPQKGPTTYEDKEYITVTRQIIIGGRNKYLINGQAAQENRVADLFQSVQLNVNNPTFLIMQGRITKVLNMKPAEILSLLEEASGTKMYEKKKQVSLKTLEKKQQRLDEIDQTLQTDIVPDLERMRKKCHEYEEYTKCSSHRDRLLKWCIAFDYTKCQKIIENSGEDIGKLEKDEQGKRDEKAALQQEGEELSSQIKDLQTEKELQAGGEVAELKAAVDSLHMELSKSSTQLKNKRDGLKADAAALKQLQAQLADLQKQDLEAVVAAATVARDAAKDGVEKAEQGVEAATRELAGAEAGDGRDESNRSLEERLADAVKQQTAADAEAQRADVAAKHLTKQLAEQRKALAASEKAGGALQKELQKQQAQVDECTSRLQQLHFDEGAMRQLEARREAETAEVRRCKDQVDRLQQDTAGCNFTYQNPGRNFDGRKVHGVIAQLVRIKDPAASTALEVAAGGKLFQVVVDDEATAKELLERGQLRKRVTMVPLNKVSYHNMSPQVLSAAQQLSGGRARPALDYLEYDERLAPAIKYAFSNVFICQDAGTAKKLAFSREVNMRCVTLEGDDFNPSGLLTGGSRNTGPSILTRLTELAAAQAALQQHGAALHDAEQQLASMAAATKEHRRLQQNLELAAHSLSLAQQRMAGSEGAQLAAAVKSLEEQLAAAQTEATAAAGQKKQLVEQAKALEREIKDFDKDRGSRIKAAQDKLKKAKAAVEASRKALRQAEQALVAAEAEREAASGEVASLQIQIATAQKTLEAAEAEVAALEAKVSGLQANAKASTERLKGLQARLSECDHEIAALGKKRERLERLMTDCDKDAKKINDQIKAKREEAAGAVKWAARAEADYAWLESEKRHFGTGDYDFSKFNPTQQKKEYEDVVERCDQLKGRVKPSVISNLQRAEADYKSLTEKRQIVEADKQKLQQVIEELDVQSKEAVKDVWIKVNASFGSIFSTLLPGTTAKLEPPEGMSYMEGLEVRVAFGDVWKESLTELSGGQRSLIALSLILALCRFKPAPIYILDEVDAALDLNHTQNIGRMIRENFPESQFIIVSLKEGMFNNANVLYRTKFIDGVSTVTRTATDGAAGMGGRRGAENAGKAAAAAAGGARNRAALRDSNRS